MNSDEVYNNTDNFKLLNSYKGDVKIIAINSEDNKYKDLKLLFYKESDNGMLDIMLGHLQAIEDGKITQEKAEVKLGEQVAEKYLKLTTVD